MIKYKDQYDVIVVGGGTGGVPAAIAAARNGASVLLIEKDGFLGGTETAGMQVPWGYQIGKNVWQDLKDPYVEGIFIEILGRLRELGALATEGFAWDEAVLKFVLEDMCLKAGVQILLHSFVFRVSVDGHKIMSVEVANKSGARTFSGKYFIDGTGSADLVALAGASWEKGRTKDGATQAMTLTFRLGGVDTDKLPKYSPDRHRFEVEKTGVKEMPEDIANMHKAYLEAQKNGEITSPRPFLTWWRYFRPGVVHSDTVWVQNLDGTKAEDLTEAEINGKRQVIEMLKFLRKFPAFKNAYIMQMGSEIGVRETRRIVGEYLLTKEDLLNGKKFDDGVARGFGAMAIHGAGEQRTIAISVPPYTTYDIPYRSLIPKDLENVLVGSKCISCTHEALGAVREEAPVSAIGQASGTAAALACKNNVMCKQLDVTLLRRTLKEQGANIWQPGMPG